MRRLDFLKSSDSALASESALRAPLDSHRDGVTSERGVSPLPVDARDVAGRCLVWLMSDAPWRDLGYAGRPIAGLLQRMFRSGGSAGREHFLRRELLALITSAYGVSGCLDEDDIQEVVALYAADPLIFGPLGFAGQGQTLTALGRAVEDYRAVPVSQWRAVLVARMRMAAQEQGWPKSELEAGASRICDRLSGIVNRLAIIAASRRL